MRQEFVVGKDAYLATKQCPWAKVVQPVSNGFLCFECIYEHLKWGWGKTVNPPIFQL